MSDRRTMGEHIEATRLRVHGPMGEEPISGWDQRIGAMIFDGRPLAEHQLLAEKEPSKRINEMLGAAYALVGSGADAEIAELRSLPTRQGIATPDFAAQLFNGREVRVEVCALTNEAEQEYLNAVLHPFLRALAHRARHRAGIGGSDRSADRARSDGAALGDLQPSWTGLSAATRFGNCLGARHARGPRRRHRGSGPPTHGDRASARCVCVALQTEGGAIRRLLRWWRRSSMARDVRAHGLDVSLWRRRSDRAHRGRKPTAV